MDDLDVALRAVLAGDREAYRRVVIACEPGVRLVVASVLPDNTSVDDVVNEVFLTAYLKLDTFTPGTDFGAWVRSIAWHKARNERRRRLRARATEDRYRAAAFELVEPELDALVDSVAGELYGKLRECVGLLPQAMRTVVERHYFQGVAASDIGRTEGRKQGWARLVLFRARAALVNCLRSKGALGTEAALS